RELSRGRAEATTGELSSRLSAKNNLTIVPVGSKEKLRDEVTEADRAELVSGQEEKLNLLVADIGRLQAQAVALRKNVLLEIFGHTDGSGTEARNSTLSQERANTIADALQARLPSGSNVTIRAAGTKDRLRDEVTEADRATNRSVTFKVIATDVQ
ncbi:MAG TPA: OmpA family protein, partial [Pyrinomonadaceae bacterium]|nr:OmpA family protein [Pyrinomonadaceae bacterium]